MISSPDNSGSIRFDTVYAEELEAINAARPREKPELQRFLVGLALSGGGIRSATFNLGLLRGLARHGLLTQIDYLSTVSGGGYIGTWLTAWSSREDDGIIAVQNKLGGDREPSQVGHLRRFSNYLTPKRGLFSADLWTAFSIHSRNTLLNLCVLIPVLMLVLMAPYGLTWVAQQLAALPFVLVGLLGTALLGYDMYRIARGVKKIRATADDPVARPWGGGKVTAFIFIVATWLLALALAASPDGLLGEAAVFGAADVSWPRSRHAAFTLFFAVLTASVTGYVVYRVFKATAVEDNDDLADEPLAPRLLVVLWSFLAGALMGFGLALVQQWAGGYDSLVFTSLCTTPFVMVVIAAGVGLHIGLMGRDMSEEVREWWARLAAWVTIFAVAWVALFAFAYLAPPLLDMLWSASKEWTAGLGLGWLGASGIGVGLGRSELTASKNSQLRYEILARAAPFVFIVGIFALVTTVNEAFVIDALHDDDQCRAHGHLFVDPVAEGGGDNFVFSLKAAACSDATLRLSHLFGLVFVASVIAVVMTFRIDINLFSLHALYRNRLARCYLGASRHKDERRPDEFTNFDFEDNLPLIQRRGERNNGVRRWPFHIINAALNITGGKHLAWQERMAASFTMTPLHCGYVVSSEGPRAANRKSYYCRSDEYLGAKNTRQDRLHVASAMAISGAAASPNMGYHSSTATAFLMTIFNVRLGWWLPNTKFPERWNDGGPHSSVVPLFKELFGMSDESSDYVYVSDGGHFDNLGIYELVRRGCRYIIASDAGADSGYQFEDLGNAIRKCRIDFGVEIDIDPSNLIPDPATGISPAPCVVGKIDYGDYRPCESAEGDQPGPRLAPGWLIYIKAAVTSDAPSDVVQYRARNPAFPHESTADQWFSESQFESYRALGGTIAFEVFEHLSSEQSEAARLDDATIVNLRNRWVPSSANTAENFTRHADALNAVWRRLQENHEDLGFMDEQLFPEWPSLLEVATEPAAAPAHLWLPDRESEIRAGFYLCTEFIQLMENVYLDLDLEHRYDHPDNRGWMNLFKHWSWSGMLRATWALSAGTFGSRFEQFCKRHLNLAYNAPTAGSPVTVGALIDAGTGSQADASGFNFVERDLIAGRAQTIHDEGIEVERIEAVQIFLSMGLPAAAGARELKFPVGYALAITVPGGETCIVDFRIQDHLRRMGLGTSGLLAIGRRYKTWSVPERRLLARIHRVDETEPNIERFAALLESIRMHDRVDVDPEA